MTANLFSPGDVTKYCDSTSVRCDLRHTTKRAMTPRRFPPPWRINVWSTSVWH